MVRIYEIRLDIGENEKNLISKAKKILNTEIKNFHIVKKSIDARRKNDVFYSYIVDCEPIGKYRASNKVKAVDEEKYCFPSKASDGKIIIVGSGPAGLFSGLMLAEAGYKPVIIERGGSVDERIDKTEAFFKSHILDTETNIQFGEGGAGTFSDGKLNTGINDIRIKRVLEEFVRFGANEDILYDAMPHIGTDVLRDVVKNIRKRITELGGAVMFNTKLVDIVTENKKIVGATVKNSDGESTLKCDAFLLAIGHSSRDTIKMLYSRGLDMKQKPFSVGVRIEHKQDMINMARYGDFAEKLPPAPYKLWTHLESGNSLYTFCMCPGGYVVNAASEECTAVTNGMSNKGREGENANSALMVNVIGLDGGVFSGIDFQRSLEKKAFSMCEGTYKLPVQTLGAFMEGRVDTKLGDITPTAKSGYCFCDLNKLFPSYITDTIKKGIIDFDKKIKGFASPDAILTAPETRCSSPVTVIRDKETFATSIKGVYSAGEGGGHSGGITSSAVDGIKNAEMIVRFLAHKEE